LFYHGTDTFWENGYEKKAGELQFRKKYGCDPSSVIKIVKMKYNRIDLKWYLVSTSTVSTFNRKIVEICKFDIPNTHMNDPSWLSSGTLIKSDGVKLVYSRFF
jgi:hypothetical protein